MAFTPWMRGALRGEPLLVHGDGMAIRDFTDVAGIVEATLRAATSDSSGNRIYNVAGGSPVCVSEILAELVEEDLEIEYFDSPLGDPPRSGGIPA